MQAWYDEWIMIPELADKFTYWESRKFNLYRHNWALDIGSTKIYIAYQANSERITSRMSCIVEFNPSKVQFTSPYFRRLLKRFFHPDNKFLEVVSCDVAVDFEVNITNCWFDRRLKKQWKVLNFGGGLDDLTFYIGKGYNRVKVYNKARELGLPGNLTRYEVTLELKCVLNEIWKDKSIPYDYPVLLWKDDSLLIGAEIGAEEKIFLIGLWYSPELWSSISAYKKRQWVDKLQANVFTPERDKLLQALSDWLGWYRSEFGYKN